MDADGFYIAIVTLHSTDADADGSIEPLEQRIATTDTLYSARPWSDVFTSVEIWSEGRLMFAKLYTELTRLWLNLPALQDSLLLHE